MIRYLKDIEPREIKGIMKAPGAMVAKDYLTTLPENMRLFSKMTILPGEMGVLHTHPGETEIIFVISGKIIMTDNGEDHVLEPGDAHINFEGEEHAIAAIGDGPAVGFIMEKKAQNMTASSTLPLTMHWVFTLP